MRGVGYRGVGWPCSWKTRSSCCVGVGADPKGERVSGARVVRAVVGAKDPARALAQRVEHDPSFAEFADRLLVALGKAQVHETGAILVTLDDDGDGGGGNDDND